MGKTPKRDPDDHAERLKREREFRELLERRRARDEELAAARRERDEQS